MSLSANHARLNARQRCFNRQCRAVYDLNERLYVCPRCDGLLEIELELAGLGEPDDLRRTWRTRRGSLRGEDRSGVWRFRELLPFTTIDGVVSLAEGNTPLYEAPRSAQFCRLQSLRLKHQGCNPTGSFKDTGMTTAITQALVLNANTVVCASTGNTAASLAAYAARAHLSCAILVPEGQVSHAKLAQSLDYSATVLEIEGNFDDAMRVIRELAADSRIYLVNSINPFRIEGQKTVAAELLEQLDWQVPDHLVLPGGNLGNASAFGKGLQELRTLGLVDRIPRITAVQAEGAAPFADLFARQAGTPVAADDVRLEPVENPITMATAIKIGNPVSWPKAWHAIQDSGGQVLTVTEEEIAEAKAVIGRDGIGCEPASATTVAGIKRLVERGWIQPDATVVAVLTGHLLKDTDYVINYHQRTLRAPAASGDKTASRALTGQFANQPRRVKADAAAIAAVLNS